jgi:Beta-galactosidase
MRKIRVVIALAALAAAVVATAPVADAGRLPKRFFGIAPQTALTQADTDRMRRGGVGSIRVPVPWNSIQPSETGGYNWADLDQAVQLASTSGLDVFPFLYGTPSWLAAKPTTLPVQNARQRGAWIAFLRAIVDRYGPGGPVAPIPIRYWQLWNEENFFYFTEPVSAARYAQFLKISSNAIRGEDPTAKLILGGLFAKPKGRPSRAQDAVDFLDRLYRVRGIKSRFDGVALHPYAPDSRRLERFAEALRRVMIRNGDRRTGFYVTEMGWGSEARSGISFEKGPRGQARELRRAYSYLIRNRGKLNLKRVYWFSWKDAPNLCTFCDSVGLFRGGDGFSAKPAWYSFVKITGGMP